MDGKNPLIPMGAITGTPDRARMREVLTACRDAGIEQYLIYPRTGLEIEYMSEAWLRLCRDTVEIAAELGMHIWLYDEFNFPSGNCRGQVTEGHPELYPNALVFERRDGRIVSRVVRNRVGADILNPAAVARFIALTHQRYYDTMKEYFGTVIRGIFTDEPSFAYYVWNGDGTLTEPVAEDAFLLPWYDGLEAEYRNRCGRELRSDVEAWMEGGPCGPFREVYHRVMGDRMRTVYIGEIDRWCVDHGIVFTGHLMAEHAPNSVDYNGNPLKMLKTFSFPGMDEIRTHTVLDSGRIDFSAMMLAQYAGQGKPGQMAELFAVAPTDTPMMLMRQMIWLVSCFGVDHYLLAVASLDPKGNIGKCGYYFPTGTTQPWFPYYRELTETAKEAARNARRPWKPELRVRFPAELFMRIRHDPACEALLPAFPKLLEELAARQVQALYLDEDEQTELPVITMDGRGFLLEGCDRRFDDPETFVGWLLERYPRRCIVTDETGAETRNVMVRLWEDGTVTLVDLTAGERAERMLTVSVDGRCGRVRLPGKGVFCGRPEEADDHAPTAPEPAEIRGLHMETEQDNLLRCLYTQKDPDVVLEAVERVENVRMLMRRDPEPVAATLDGVPLEPAEEDGRLPDGFRQLYRATKPFTLEKGRHVLKIADGEVKFHYWRASQTAGVFVCDHIGTGAVDYRYLPSMWLAGDFLCSRDGKIWPNANEEVGCAPLRGIPDYAGSFRLTGRIRIPDEPGLMLRLDTDFACTELRIGGRLLGTRCWTPYEWEIPEDLRGGEQEFSVRITTSVRPMFGDDERHADEQPHWTDVLPRRSGDAGLMNTPVWVRKKG